MTIKHDKANPVKRILYLSSAGDVAGSEIALLQYLQHYESKRYEISVVCCQTGKFPSRLHDEGIPHVVTPLIISLKGILQPSLIIQNITSLWNIYRQLNDTSVDLVVTNDTMVLKILFLPLLYCRTPVIYHLRNYEWKRLWMVRRLFRKPHTHGIAVSNAVRKHYKNVVGIPDRLISVVHLSTPSTNARTSKKTKSLRRELQLSRNHRLIGLVARFDVWKGHLTLLRAIERVAKQFPAVHLAIVGEILNPETFPFLVEYKAKVLQYASRPGLTTRVHFLGWRNDMPNVFRSLDIVVNASESEPFGLVTLEAMTYGIPIIGSDSGGTPEIIVHEKNGMLFRTGDDADLAQHLLLLLQQPRRAKQLAVQGRATVRKHFTMQAYINSIEQQYDRILS